MLFYVVCRVFLESWGFDEILLKAEVSEIRVWGYTTLPDQIHRIFQLNNEITKNAPSNPRTNQNLNPR
jgi:hypothetical protein